MESQYAKYWSRHRFPGSLVLSGPMVLFAILCFAISAFAQEYPTKPVTMVVGFSEGSSTDLFAHVMSKKLSELWGQQVVIEYRVGGGGSLGTDAVAKSAPDGYTLLFNGSAHITNAVLYNKLPYDPIQDFVAIGPIAIQPFILVVGPSAGVKSVSELIALAKAKPGQVKFGSPGIGSGAHFCAEKFRLAVGIDVLHIPFKGGVEANAAAMSGKITYWLAPAAAALQSVKEGKLIALAVVSAKRLRGLPNVPTMAQAGVRVEDTNWFGMWAPAGIPDAIADKLVKDVARAVGSPDVREQIIKLGAEPMSMSQAEFTRFVRSELETADRIVKVMGIKPFPR